MAKAVPLTIDQGTTWIAILTIKSGVSAWDLTDYEFRMQIRTSAQSTTITAEPTCTILDATAGQLQIKLTATETSAIPATGTNYANVTEYYYDVEMESESGTVWRLMNGPIYVSPEVTK